jgi:hypothetical protein
MSLERSIEKAYKTAVDRGWDTIYVMVDVHDTIAESTYKDAEVIFYPQAIATLRELSKMPEVHLVLWTCCYEKDYPKYTDKLSALGVNFKSVNETPVKNTLTGCFDVKPYFSVLIDDKAGFDSKEWHWVLLYFQWARKTHQLKKNGLD